MAHSKFSRARKLIILLATGVAIAISITALLHWLLLPPQCPNNMTQAEVDSSRCIIGANIGGEPIFYVVTIFVWLSTLSAIVAFARDPQET